MRRSIFLLSSYSSSTPFPQLEYLLILYNATGQPEDWFKGDRKRFKEQAKSTRQQKGNQMQELSVLRVSQFPEHWRAQKWSLNSIKIMCLLLPSRMYSIMRILIVFEFPL